MSARPPAVGGTNDDHVITRRRDGQRRDCRTLYYETQSIRFKACDPPIILWRITAAVIEEKLAEQS